MTEQKRITVIIVDDHHLIREAIRGMLKESEHIDIVGEGWAGEHLFSLMEEKQPDVVLLDLMMPHHENGDPLQKFAPIQALQQLHDAYPETAVILISSYASPSVIQGAIKKGVRGYLLKSDQLSLNMVDAIDAIHHGGVYFSREISQQLFNSNGHKADDNQLTERQLEIVLAIARNLDATHKEVAQTLHITESTMKGHLNNIFRILDVANVTACIIRCMELGLIPFRIDERGRIEFGDFE
ncbi:MAG: response regulator transcription factor [Anaerolineales bacterium]|nr:response regulator transcription factor [Anaerolineales bacterium]